MSEPAAQHAVLWMVPVFANGHRRSRKRSEIRLDCPETAGDATLHRVHTLRSRCFRYGDRRPHVT
jgi:hypothetical protein